MRSLTQLLVSVIILSSILTSCTIERRHYRNGFYINHQHDHNVADNNSVQEESQIVPVQQSLREDEPDKNETARTVQLADSIVRPVEPEINKEKNSSDAVIEESLKPDERDAKRTDQPQPEKEAPNRTILILILIAIVLAFAPLLAILPVSLFLFTLALCAPAIAVLLYLIALNRRRKILDAIARGEKGDKYRVSNYYHRFSLALHVFFGGLLAGQIGIAVLYLTGLLGLAVGITICAITLCSIMLVFLLVLSIVYLLKWRKVGENRPKPWEKRPKDG